MANERPKIEPVTLRIHKCRPAFFKLHEATWRTNKTGQIDKGKDGKKKPRYQVTLLLDPTDPQSAEDIKAIKDEAARQMDIFFGGRANWPKANPATGLGAPIYSFGNGNDLPKVYKGFENMFYVKCATTSSLTNPTQDAYDLDRPLLGALNGRGVQFLSDGQWHYLDKDRRPTEEIAPQDICPYAGCNARARISLYVFDNESRGVNTNIHSLQFVSKNEAFGGGGARRSADEEFESYQEYAKQNDSAPDPFG